MGNVYRFDRAQNDLTSKESPVPAAQAFFVSAGLSLLFIIVYGTSNWLASRRPDVPTFFFKWELSLPFIPLFVVPYLSIDLFFVAAPFICRGSRELRTFSLRIATAIVVAGLCF